MQIKFDLQAVIDITSKYDFNGIAYIINDDKEIFNHISGYSDRQNSKMMTDKDTFTYSFYTKCFVNMAMLQCEQKGLIRFSDTLDKYINSFRPQFRYTGLLFRRYYHQFG